MAARAVEGDHPLGPETLPEGVAGGQGLEFADELAVPAARQIGLDPTLQRRKARFLQTGDLAAGKFEVGHVRVRLSAPKGQGVPKAKGCTWGVAPSQGGVGVVGRGLEPGGVQGFPPGRERVARRSRLDEILAQGSSEM